jgi:hypothetical protein
MPFFCALSVHSALFTTQNMQYVLAAVEERASCEGRNRTEALLRKSLKLGWSRFCMHDKLFQRAPGPGAWSHQKDGGYKGRQGRDHVNALHRTV